MTIHDQMFLVASQPVLENQHGELIVIAMQNREPAEVTAIVSEEKRRRRYSETGIKIVHERTATVTAELEIAEFSRLRAAKLLTTITVSGIEYAVEDMAMNGNSVTFSLVRDAVMEISRPGYRDRGYGR